MCVRSYLLHHFPLLFARWQYPHSSDHNTTPSFLPFLYSSPPFVALILLSPLLPHNSFHFLFPFDFSPHLLLPLFIFHLSFTSFNLCLFASPTSFLIFFHHWSLASTVLLLEPHLLFFSFPFILHPLFHEFLPFFSPPLSSLHLRPTLANEGDVA